MLNWLKLKIIFPITAGLEDSEEISDVQRMQMGLKDGDQYETETGVYQLTETFTITQLNPKCFVPREKTNKKYYTEIVFSDSSIINADGKPEAVYKQIEDYIDSFPNE